MPGIRGFQNEIYRQGHSAARRLDSVLVKPAGPDCNLACDYCFYLQKNEVFPAAAKHRMSHRVLEELIKQMLASPASEVSFGWQGGEPTLMGLDFFEKVVELQKKYGAGKSISNGLQTNGLRLDKKWARFLREYRFLVGLSLDGPAPVHDRYRKNKKGKGSWGKVMESLKTLLDAQVMVNALTVVNDHSVDYPKEIYEFHKEQGLIHQQYIPCVEKDPASPDGVLPFSVSPEKYGEFLCTLFDLWLDDFKDGVPTTFIRHFDSMLFGYVGRPVPECTLRPTCGSSLVVEHTGDVFPCDFYVNSEDKLGNIRKDCLHELYNSKEQRSFGDEKAILHPSCRDCKWLERCFGGCLKDRLGTSAEKPLSHLCRAYRLFFNHADGHLSRLARDFKKRQAGSS